MKSLLAFLLLLLVPIMSAQPALVISPEEAELLQAFRQNPEPFRALLRRSFGPAEVVTHPPATAPQLLGPRDAIDVSISGVRIAFYGKRSSYQPTTIRLVRGEEAVIEFVKESNPMTISNPIVIAYRGDGLHFDIPESWNGRPERGLVVIPEGREWNQGEPIRMQGALSGYRTRSEAEGVEFRIRYVSRR